jgi:hypothetical protein
MEPLAVLQGKLILLLEKSIALTPRVLLHQQKRGTPSGDVSGRRSESFVPGP